MYFDLLHENMSITCCLTLIYMAISTDSAILISRSLVSVIRPISKFMGIISVKNVNDGIKTNHKESDKGNVCPMKMGKPFAKNYMDNMFDKLGECDWNIDLF